MPSGVGGSLQQLGPKLFPLRGARARDVPPVQRKCHECPDSLAQALEVLLHVPLGLLHVPLGGLQLLQKRNKLGGSTWG